MAEVKLSARQAWMSSKIQDTFGLDEETVAKCLTGNGNPARLTAFFEDMESPKKFFVLYQPRQFTKPELFLSFFGNNEKLEGKCCYFLRASKGKPIKETIGQDSTCLFGMVNDNILATLEQTLSGVYTPLLNAQKEWGLVKDAEEKKGFTSELTTFGSSLKYTLANLSGDVTLKTPDAPFDQIDQKPAAYARAAKSAETLTHFQGIVTSWCEVITKYMASDPSNVPMDTMDDSGPELEIERWSRRMLTLVSVTEQLKSKSSRVVTGVLKARALRTDADPDSNDAADQEQIKNLIERWREVDLAITDSLNESKDNVRFLENLRQVIAPLYSEKPGVISNTMPSLMNSMKMIHTLSRHYGTEVRMTNLFERITNQLVARCKDEIHGGLPNSNNMWTQNPEDVIAVMKDCIDLCVTYQQTYTETKEKLAAMNKGKQFNFDENVIFSKVIRFRRRLEKLIDMFSCIHQFKRLKEKRIDDMGKLIDAFDQLVAEFKTKGHNLLDFYSTAFERDFVEFAMHNSGLENAVQDFMERSLVPMPSINKRLEQLQKFRDVLHREPLVDDLQAKYVSVMHRYGKELQHVSNEYEKHKENPPIPRNMTRIAGNIHWSRQLMRNITQPMKTFQDNPKVFQHKESKKIVKHFNKLARILIEFETMFFEAFTQSADVAKKGLQSKLLTEVGDSMYKVNFDSQVLELMREARHLSVLGFNLPNSAKIVLLLEPKLTVYLEDLGFYLARYAKLHADLNPACMHMLKPHFADLKRVISPAVTTMTWASMNIPAFLQKLDEALKRMEFLVDMANDIIVNRIEKNIDFISTLLLFNLPDAESVSVDNFSKMQAAHIASCTTLVVAKNAEVEQAVTDLVNVCNTYTFNHDEFEAADDLEVNFVKLHFSHLMYHAVLDATCGSLKTLKDRIANADTKSKPLFALDVSLQVPNVMLVPSIDDIQVAVNKAAKGVLQASRQFMDWGLDPTARPRSPKPLFDRLASDHRCVLAVLLLSGGVNAAKTTGADYLVKYEQYSWLWNQEPEQTYNDFVENNNPVLEDFIGELKKFVSVEEEVGLLAATEDVASLCVNTEGIKQQIKHECQRWKGQYSERMHAEVKKDMDGITEQMAELTKKLQREVKDLNSLKLVMDGQTEVRDAQSWIQQKFSSIISRYAILENYLPAGLSKDEMDAKSVLKNHWDAIIQQSESAMSEVGGLQDGFKVDLINKVRAFKKGVKAFKSDYDENGPMVKGVPPAEAMIRLAKYKREFETFTRKYDLYNGGERLFGLPEMKYSEIEVVKKELKLLDQLYSLYQDVITTIDDYKNINWSDVVVNIQNMNDTVEGFQARCKKLPKALKTWDAYLELNGNIEQFIELLPLLSEMAKDAMRERHWVQISELTGTDFDLERFNELKLKTVLEAVGGEKLALFREDIEEITDGAEKQLGIESKLKDIADLWEITNYEFSTWKERGDVILNGGIIAEITEKLEESQSALVQMLTQRHVTPFRELASGWLKKLSDVGDTMERWVKVQLLWMSLEAVFTGGDIARQMPQDTRVFLKVDKEWCTRLMTKAKDVENVVECCQNEYIKAMLPTMIVDLEKCQKALDGYLEAKRNKFPRFYFVSNPALLQILSQGSDKDACQDCFPKIFDSVSRVEFTGNTITQIRTKEKGTFEDIPLTKPVSVKGNIEDWLAVLLLEQMRSIKDVIRVGANEYESKPLGEFVTTSCAQVSLLGIQFMWTADVQEAINRCKHDKTSIVNAAKKHLEVLTELSAMTTQEIPTKLERIKVETLVTIQVHQKEVLDTIVKKYKEKKLKDVHDFLWQSQLRCEYVPDQDECFVRICDVDFAYCYEYLGVKERLCVTPLTDRCYITLSQAMGMFFGGAPAGPAGTGKTETVKDLGRGLGKYVVVFNCSDQMHTADTAKIYKGLCMSGSWGCFDEFNRIDLEVLSVVAQQVEAVLGCIRARQKQFSFPGDDIGPIQVDTRCGFFITMNPGYAGRQELPENLKALFRSMAMMVPDREIIMKVKLASVGYLSFAILGLKFRVLYGLCEEQLSKQRHYDFGLRNILSVLRTAGVNLRLELLRDPNQERLNLEEMLMMRTLRDMNLSKLVADDGSLFIDLLHDLFPNQPDPVKKRYDDEEDAMHKIVEEWKYVNHDSWLNKAVQLYETSLVRHGLMMIGPAGGGKTIATMVLLEALSQVYDKTKMVKMNPKAIKAEEMFGQNDLISGEWTHGIFSKIWSLYNDSKKPFNTWICCDGPVDAIWIENLNTVLDDNKLLTLANGDRLPMTDNVRILFEAEDLRNASPATVSRAGIIYVSAEDLGYSPVEEAWMAKRRADEQEILREVYNRIIMEPELVDWVRKNVHSVMQVSLVHLVTNLLALMECQLVDSDAEQVTHSVQIYERLVLYSAAWSLGGLLENEDRSKLSAYLQTLCPDSFPDTSDGSEIYDFFVNTKTWEWERWMPPTWEFDHDTFKFETALVPTVDSTRAEYLIKIMCDKIKKPVLVVGSSGTAKTSLVLQYTESFDEKMLLKKINFSSATTGGMFQTSIEADIEKRQGKTFAPSGGRQMTCFLDDISMPEVNDWGDQPTLEIVRQLIEDDGFYFLDKERRGDKMTVVDLVYVGAMSHPGGGRNDIPNRLKRHFFTMNMTPPQKNSIDNIYGSMLRGRFDEHPDLVDQVETITGATIDLWYLMKARMLPTPAKFHYVFNMRDLSRVFQGILQCPNEILDHEDNLLNLWFHENERVFSDKLTNEKDQKWYQDHVYDIAAQHFSEEQIERVKGRKDPIYYVDYLRGDVIDPETDEVLEEAPKVYEPAHDIPHMKEMVNEFLEKYNNQGGGVQRMDLVLFEDALGHMMRISRIIGMPRGNALLVGVGGSGRQSLTRLAAFIARHMVFQIKLSRSYKVPDFLDDIRKLYTWVGKEGKKVTWVFTDFEIINENFLEYINAILATGEIAGLFPKDERDMMCVDLRGPAKRDNPDFDDTPDNLYKYFIERIRSNLHIVLCFSPANEKFPERARKFPGLIAGCTIDWFLRWPVEALIDVSSKFLSEGAGFKLDAKEEVKASIVNHIAEVHDLVTNACTDYLNAYRRAVFVTPKSYLSFIKSYKAVYTKKLNDISVQERNVNNGLEKLREAEVDVEKMKGVLAVQNVELKQADIEATAMLQKVEVGTKEANIKKAAADVIEDKCSKTAAQINEEKAEANKELEAAMPFVHAATEAAKAVTKKDVGIITKLGKPPDLIKRIMDCVLLLLVRRLDPISLTEIKTGKTDTEIFIMDSYDTYAKKVMNETDFTNNLLDFALVDKDKINDETMELLDPYLRVKDFNAERAKSVANAAEGLCKWVRAMYQYHIAALIVAPKLEMLQVKDGMFKVAMKKLNEAKASSKAAQDTVDALQAQFDETMAQKAALNKKAQETADKMVAANNLIKSLGGEKVRWAADAKGFALNKERLVGDCALACAFVSYLGPFNQVYRSHMINSVFLKDCHDKNIPVSSNMEVTSFLVDEATVAEWNTQGLPKDDLSVQNGILVTQASRFPLLIDPQGQALSWLKKREAEHFPVWGTTTLSNVKLRDQLEFCMEEGKPLLIEGVVKEVDPMLDPVLEKNVVAKGRSFFIQLGDKQVGLDKNFRMFLLTKLPNPTFSPELSAKTTVIDFSVTQKGLEDQLLSRVIQKEQASLEEQRQALVEEVNINTINLQALDANLLDMLSNSTGNLLENIELINTLAETKTKAQEVKEKIEASDSTQLIISKKREQYRPVATRGSVVYFVITSLALINVMYQNSLAQFLGWFDGSLAEAEKANMVNVRVSNLMDHLTFNCYVNVDRGLFETDKVIFKLMMTTKITITEKPEVLNDNMVALLLRGGAMASEIAKNPFKAWLPASSWLNLCALCEHLDFFGDLKTTMQANDAEFRRWFEQESPEGEEIPVLEERLQENPSGYMYRLLLIRSFRDDRLRLAANEYIAETIGRRYVEPLAVKMEDIWDVSSTFVPVIMLLTPGADPTTSLQDLAKRKGLKVRAVSMGEGQEKFAQRAMDESMEEGGWTLLQNCHLGLGFMNHIDEDLRKAEEEQEEKPVHTEFRLWITCEPHPDFPINLLQMGVKVTNEPPAGMKAGLFRSYTSVVDAERLGRVETKSWRDLVYATCFLHSVVQERRKFGSIGWCIPYEYNTGDQEASLTFLEKHSFSAQGLNWETIQYMLCEAQYGGRITDDFDRILFGTFGRFWFHPGLFEEGFKFVDNSSHFDYILPTIESIEEYRSYVTQFPAHDSPEIFGLHTNADLTFGTAESNYILETINETQPKNTAAKAGAKTREELVIEKCDELVAQIPETYADDILRDYIRKRKTSEMEFVLGYKSEERVDGFTIPLNVFLYQEMVRITDRIHAVHDTLVGVKQAINGEVIMTPEYQNALDAISEGKPPKSWYIDPSGAGIAWTLPTLGMWFTGMLDRERQLTEWMKTTRPNSYWLTGFFNPQGFLTATRQEVTRRHKAEKWALDDVVLQNTMMDTLDAAHVKKHAAEGVYIHGLFMEGCSWDHKSKTLKESAPKELFTPMPVLWVTAITSEKSDRLYAGTGATKYYECPCYTKPQRNALAYVFTVKMPTTRDPDHWILRGVALLCSKD